MFLAARNSPTGISLLPVLRSFERSDGDCRGIIIFWPGYRSQSNTIVLDKVGFVRSYIGICDVADGNDLIMFRI